MKPSPVCEVTPILDALEPPGWFAFEVEWRGHPDCDVLDPHHVHGRSEGDADWNVVTVRRVAHEFVQSTRVGRLVCLLALERRGALDIDAATLKLRRNPVALVCVDLEAGVFTGRCEEAARELCRRYGL